MEFLDYFKDFNNNKLCLCKKDKGEYKEEKPKIFIFNMLQEYLHFYFDKLLSHNLLLIYDAVTIFDITLDKIECSEFTKLKYKIDYIKVNKILIPYREMEIQYNLRGKLWIRQIKYSGVYYSLEYNKEIYFNFEFDRDQESDISIIYGKIIFTLENLVLFCDFCNQHPEEYERLGHALKNDYGKYLKDTTKDYYN